MKKLGYREVRTWNDEFMRSSDTGWSMSPVKACEWVDSTMTEIFPLGVVKDETEGLKQQEEAAK